MINVMRLNHPKTIPPALVLGKIVFHKNSPWCQKGWGLLFDRTHILSFLCLKFQERKGHRMQWKGPRSGS